MPQSAPAESTRLDKPRRFDHTSPFNTRATSFTPATWSERYLRAGRRTEADAHEPDQPQPTADRPGH